MCSSLANIVRMYIAYALYSLVRPKRSPACGMAANCFSITTATTNRPLSIPVWSFTFPRHPTRFVNTMLQYCTKKFAKKVIVAIITTMLFIFPFPRFDNPRQSITNALSKQPHFRPSTPIRRAIVATMTAVEPPSPQRQTTIICVWSGMRMISIVRSRYATINHDRASGWPQVHRRTEPPPPIQPIRYSPVHCR